MVPLNVSRSLSAAPGTEDSSVAAREQTDGSAILRRALTDISRRDSGEGGTLALVEDNACMHHSRIETVCMDHDASVTATLIAGMA